MTDTRTRRGPSKAHASRATADAARQTDGLLADDADSYRRMVRDEFVQEALPQIPSPPGWHYCWLPTNSAYDPVHKRLRMGYSPVSFEEVSSKTPGLDIYRVSAGDYSGCMQCNEMVLFKITQDRYQLIMETFHHNMPREAEGQIRSRIEEMAAKFTHRGTKLLDLDREDEGLSELGEDHRPVPIFD
jgi:hypothetical protein